MSSWHLMCVTSSVRRFGGNSNRLLATDRWLWKWKFTLEADADEGPLEQHIALLGGVPGGLEKLDGGADVQLTVPDRRPPSAARTMTSKAD